MKFYPYWKKPIWWIQTADLPLSKKEIVNFLIKCQNADGGFGNSPHSPSYTESSYYAIVVLGWLDSTNIIRKDDAINFFMSRHNIDGGFGDEPQRESDIYNTYYAIISLNMLDALNNIDIEKTISFMLTLQKPDGGFNENYINDSDILHTFWATTVLDILQALPRTNLEMLLKFIQTCQNNDGGFGSKPRKISFVQYTFEAIILLWLLGALNSKIKTNAFDFIKTCQNEDNRFGECPGSPSTMSNTLWAISLLSVSETFGYINQYKLINNICNLKLNGIWHRFCAIFTLLYLVPSEIILKPRIINLDLFKINDVSIANFSKVTETEVVKLAPQIVKLDAHATQSIIEEINTFQEFISDIWSQGEDPSKINFENKLRVLGELIYYSILPDTLEESYKNSKQSFMNLSIDKSLLGIPWELAFDGDEYLCFKHAISKSIISDSYNFKTLNRDPSKELNILIIGCSVEELLEADREINNLLKYPESEKDIKIDCLMGKDASKSNLVKQFLKQSYDIIHFSGHTYLDQKNPDKSGLLVFNNEILDTLTIKKYLRKNPPRIVFINSCESSQGEWVESFQNEKKVIGLASAFLTLGIPFVGSYFPIFDKEAVTFSSFFYQGILQGIPLAEAMREARIKTYDKFAGKGLAWAAYNLFGNPIDRITIYRGK